MCFSSSTPLGENTQGHHQQAEAGGEVPVRPGGHREVPWSAVERVRVDVRHRLGLRSELLEIDTGETLHLFGASELGADCADVAERLAALRTGR